MIGTNTKAQMMAVVIELNKEQLSLSHSLIGPASPKKKRSGGSTPSHPTKWLSGEIGSTRQT